MRTLPAALLVLLAAGCATRVPPEQVSVHESVASAPPRYEVIKRLWTESWLSIAGVVPSYSSEKEAADAFRGHAARAGGNGVINFGCYPKTPGGSSLACNGT